MSSLSDLLVQPEGDPDIRKFVNLEAEAGITAFVDVDDLWNPNQIERWLVPLREAFPSFCLTCYSIPNKLGPVSELRAQYPWITFGIHGWEHTHFECLVWTELEAKRYLSAALEMGYSRVFKPPNWVCHPEIEVACRDLGVVLHHHPNYKPVTDGLLAYPGTGMLPPLLSLHTHIEQNPVTDHIGTHPGFLPVNLRRITRYLQDVPEVCRVFGIGPVRTPPGGTESP